MEEVTIKSFRDLLVWQQGVQLAVSIYRATEIMPRAEQYGLTSQMRRAAVSVPANVAEGCAREHTGEFLQGVNIAAGSLAELETHLVIAKELGYLSDTREFEQVTSEIGKMLNGLHRSLAARKAATSRQVVKSGGRPRSTEH